MSDEMKPQAPSGALPGVEAAPVDGLERVQPNGEAGADPTAEPQVETSAASPEKGSEQEPVPASESSEPVEADAEGEATKEAGTEGKATEGTAIDGQAPTAEAEEALKQTANAKWYAIHVYSGSEQKVLKNIQYRLEIDELAEYVARILVPTHTVLEIKNGKKVQSERNLMPGYVLIEMMPQEEVFDMISKLGGVAGFVGDGSQPVALAESEVQSLLGQTSHRQEQPKTEILFDKGEQVKIIEGPFAGFNGQVEDIDPGRGKLSVMVSIFGRQTAVELDVLQVDKL